MFFLLPEPPHYPPPPYGWCRRRHPGMFFLRFQLVSFTVFPSTPRPFFGHLPESTPVVFFLCGPRLLSYLRCLSLSVFIAVSMASSLFLWRHFQQALQLSPIRPFLRFFLDARVIFFCLQLRGFLAEQWRVSLCVQRLPQQVFSISNKLTPSLGCRTRPSAFPRRRPLFPAPLPGSLVPLLV